MTRFFHQWFRYLLGNEAIGFLAWIRLYYSVLSHYRSQQPSPEIKAAIKTLDLSESLQRRLCLGLEVSSLTSPHTKLKKSFPDRRIIKSILTFAFYTFASYL
jgi:hypothetical protein